MKQKKRKESFLFLSQIKNTLLEMDKTNTTNNNLGFFFKCLYLDLFVFNVFLNFDLFLFFIFLSFVKTKKKYKFKLNSVTRCIGIMEQEWNGMSQCINDIVMQLL